MAKRFTKPAIDWAELQKRVPPDQMSKFINFKAKSMAYFQRLNSTPEKPPPIDWAFYQKSVPIPGLVDKFKQQYEGVNVPYPEDKLSAAIDAQWSEISGEIKSFSSEMQKLVQQASKELDRIKALPRFEDMTLETFKDMFPDVALDPVNKPSFWPHNPEEQLGYVDPNKKKEAH